jgi:hypothetical protein
MGEARGIFPGRVVWVRDPSATPWNGVKTEETNWWHDKTGVNQAAVDKMTSRSIQALTGAKSDRQAWEKIFVHYNQTHGGQAAGYAKDQVVALKVNCNNCYAGYADIDDQVDASPQAILAMLRQLVHHAGVPQKNILVYEAVRVIPDRIYNPCHAEFPEVVWMDSRGDGTNGRQPINWHKDAFQYSVTEKNSCGTSIPESVLHSTYIINMALMKGHPTCGFTLTAKNHYGSINDRDHSVFINTYAHNMGIYNPFVDLIATKYHGPIFLAANGRPASSCPWIPLRSILSVWIFFVLNSEVTWPQATEEVTTCMRTIICMKRPSRRIRLRTLSTNLTATRLEAWAFTNIGTTRETNNIAGT